MTGLVFSYDEGATRYATLTEIQQPRVEIIGRFIEFWVISFRDGVSEGEYNTVATASTELEVIQAAIKTIVGGQDYLRLWEWCNLIIIKVKGIANRFAV